jgi:hypothetical protein
MNQPMISTTTMRAPTIKYRVLFDDPLGRLPAMLIPFPRKQLRQKTSRTAHRSTFGDDSDTFKHYAGQMSGTRGDARKPARIRRYPTLLYALGQTGETG